MRRLKADDLTEVDKWYQVRCIWISTLNSYLAKSMKSVEVMMPNTSMELSYEGAKEMILVENIDNKKFLSKVGRTVAGCRSVQQKSGEVIWSE